MVYPISMSCSKRGRCGVDMWMWPSEKSCFLQWMVIFDFGRIRAVKGNQHVSFALKTPLQNLMERSNPERCQPCLSPCDHVSIQRQHPERMLLSSNWQLILQIRGWELVGPQGWAGPPAEAFAPLLWRVSRLRYSQAGWRDPGSQPPCLQ